MSAKNVFRFKSFHPQEWKGRYRRIPGNDPVFHTEIFQGRWVISSYIVQGNYRIMCLALPSSSKKELIQAVNSIKRRTTGVNGGAFLVNEYGQVLVPTQYGPRFIVGEIEGSLLFRSLDTAEIVDLSNDRGLEVGDPWHGPYVGVQYNLSARSEIYFQLGNDKIVKARVQDLDLIRRIRKVRSYGAVRFIVNPYGLALLKARVGDFQHPDDPYEPVYVGRINYAKWFPKEEMEGCQISS